MRNQLKATCNRWAVLFALLYVFVAYAFALQGVPPLMGTMMNEFNIGHADAGFLMSMVVVPGIFLSIPFGVFVGKHGIKLVGFVSTVFMAAGCFMTAIATSFVLVLIGRLVFGIGGVFVVAVTPAVIPQWFSREELGKAMGIFGINMPLATVLAFPAASSLMLAYGWRYSFYFSTIIAVLAIAIFTMIVKEGPLKHESYGKRLSVSQALKNIEVWKVGGVWLLFNASALSFTTWAPKLFEDYKGFDPIYASFLPTVLMLVAIPFVPVSGWISDRVRKRKLLMVLGCLLMTLALIASAYTSNLVLVASIVVLGIAASLVPPIASALPAEILGPRLASIGFGVTAICLNASVAVAPPLIGYIIDATRSLTLGFIGMALFSLVGSIVAYTLKTS